MRQLVIRGSVWTLLGYGTSQVLRLGTNLALAYLLFPEAFGLMALVNLFVQGLAMFSDLGIGPSIVQNQRGDEPAFLNSAWTIQIIRGTLLWLIACGLAWPVASFYGEPMLLQLLPVAGLTALLAGFNSTRLFTANRHLALGRLTMIDLAAQSASIVSMVTLAWVWPSVWALVAGALVSAVVKLALSHTTLPGDANRLYLDRDACHELFVFGRWIFASTLLTFLAMYTDRAMLGKLLSMEALGVYTIGLFVASAGAEVVNKLSRIVLMPALSSEARKSAQQFGEGLLRGRRLLFTGAGLTSGLTVLLAPALISTLYDQRYQEAAWIAQLTSIGIWFSMLQRTANMGVLAIGASFPVAMSHFLNVVVTVIAAPMGYVIYGLPGFICGWSLGNLVGLLTVEASLARRGYHVSWQSVQASACLAAGIAVGMVLQSSLAAALPPAAPRWAADILGVLGMGAVTVPFLLPRLKTALAN